MKMASKKRKRSGVDLDVVFQSILPSFLGAILPLVQKYHVGLLDIPSVFDMFQSAYFTDQDLVERAIDYVERVEQYCIRVGQPQKLGNFELNRSQLRDVISFLRQVLQDLKDFDDLYDIKKENPEPKRTRLVTYFKSLNIGKV